MPRGFMSVVFGAKRETHQPALLPFPEPRSKRRSALFPVSATTTAAFAHARSSGGASEAFFAAARGSSQIAEGDRNRLPPARPSTSPGGMNCVGVCAVTE